MTDPTPPVPLPPVAPAATKRSRAPKASSPYAAMPAVVDASAPASPYAAVAPAVAAPANPYQVATVVTLVLSGVLFLLSRFGDQLRLELDGSAVLYFVALAVSIALFVVSLVLLSRTRKAGAKKLLAVLTVVLASINFATVLITGIVTVVAVLFFFSLFLM